jgi:hypothetical protein
MQRFILFILDINAEVKRMEGFILIIVLKTSTQRSRGWRDSSSSS